MKIIAVLIATITAAFSAQGADKVTYDEHVLPIFRNACLNCHNPDKRKAGLDLSTYQAALQGSENGKILQSGNAGASLLFKCVKGLEEPKMPPKGDKLNDAELAVVEQWINGQLLENATGQAIAAVANNVQVAAVSLERPAGLPPMPGDLPLDPCVRTTQTNALTALAVSPWAPLVAIGGQKQVILYHTETLQPLGVLPFPEGFPAILRFSRNGQLLLAGGGLGGKSGQVVLWDIQTGERIATVGNEFDQVLAADLSADQQFIALGGPTKLLKIYATKDGRLVHSIKKHTDWITAIAYSPDGKYVASADRGGGIQVWEGASGQEFNALRGHKAMVTGLAFMPGVLASSSEDGKVALWDAKEGKAIRDWAAHPGGAAWVDFTADGRLVSCGRDKTAKVWDQNGQALGQTEPMADIALRAGLAGDRLIAGDWTGRIRVSALDGKSLGELTSNPPSLAERIAATAKQLTEAQAALEQTTARLASAQADAERWQAAQILQNAHNARRHLAARQAQYDQLVATIKAAPLRAEKARTDLAAAEKTIQEGPAKTQEKENAFAENRAAVEAAKKALAGIEPVAAAKEQAAQAAVEAVPPAGDVAGLTEKLEEQKAEAKKMRDARNALAEGSPERNAAADQLKAFRAELAETQTALTAAGVKNLEVPEVQAARAEAATADAALEESKRAWKTAVQTAAATEKAVAQTKKELEAARQLAAKLQKDLPEIVQASEQQKAQAEQEAAVVAKEVEAAKAEVEKRGAEYDTMKSGGTKAAVLAVPPSKS